MRIIENGVCRDATPEEIAMMQAEEYKAEPTVEERLAALEALLAEKGNA